MFEDERVTRAAICGTGVLLAAVMLLAGLQSLLLIIPVGILFLGLVADPVETHAVWYGILSTPGIFDPSVLTEEERTTFARKRHYFWFGEVVSAAALAGLLAIPLGVYLAGKTALPLAITGSALIFLTLFVYLPKLIRSAMKTDTEKVIETFGKNEQTRKVFWSIIVALAGLVLAETLDLAVVQLILTTIAGSG